MKQNIDPGYLSHAKLSTAIAEHVLESSGDPKAYRNFEGDSENIYICDWFEESIPNTVEVEILEEFVLDDDKYIRFEWDGKKYWRVV